MSNINDYLSAKINLYLEAIETNLNLQIDGPFFRNWKGERCSLLEAVESPIEQLMVIALAFIETPMWQSLPGDGYRRPTISWMPYNEADLLSEASREGGVNIYPQAQVGSYRVDFLIAAVFPGRPAVHKIIVECDGHDFHERTKEQAQRDKERDRALQQDGYQVFRFTGSEIYRNPDRCAKEIEVYLSNLEYKTRGA